MRLKLNQLVRDNYYIISKNNENVAEFFSTLIEWILVTPHRKKGIF